MHCLLSQIVFEDTVTFGANDYSFDFTSLSGIFADYTNVQGRGYLVVSKDGLSCTLHMEAIINVQLKFVGKLVESIVVNGIKDGYNKIPQVIDRFRELYPEKCSLSAIPAELASSYTSLAYHTPPQHTIHIQDSRSPP
ncbi:hypothetical protein SARC_11606 [Sphaeroforma arctica JP610]|uniref:Uncharacterized protein n=1 Tax=Sphaeroforma arctica JP610 TaxID=667725 RepID=A0A0L0FGH9_9EUKA|nr:hypothetical protein SARC_11606 [Sphaeroforma arctica JP610]KNC75875.1 hypothetical protein SARC_11606 [Sphaeroforma arctica JP610]|eukprot:XP_014149777.1 hypothetical protein SARC_11606 [Sphaeroforma arctica JP610]